MPALARSARLALLALPAIAGAQRTSVRPGWRSATHALGRGRMRAERVVAVDSGFRLRLGAGDCDGAETRTVARHRFGSYTATMQTPRAPGSISALFLYADVAGGNDEIDIEIMNDGSGSALLTTWIAGVRTRELKVQLGFDPAAAAHTYGIHWSANDLRFTADDTVIGRMVDGFPTGPMRLMASAWWPVWLACTPLAEPAELTIATVSMPRVRR